MAFVAGPIESFYSPYDFDSDTFSLFSYLGATSDGVTIDRQQKQQFIKEDLYGDSVGEGIQTGIDIQVNGIWIELSNYGLFSAQTTQNDLWGINNNAGYPLSSLFGQLVLTPKPNSPAMYQIGNLAYQYYGGSLTNGFGLSYVFYNCGPINDLNENLASVLSKMPVTFKCLPYDIPDGGITLDNGVIIGNTAGYQITKLWDIIVTPAPNGPSGAGSCYFF
jgi:hypothetical protein